MVKDIEAKNQCVFQRSLLERPSRKPTYTGITQRMNSDRSMTDDLKASTGWFDVQAIARTLPETATTLLVDKYLTDRDVASARIFRVYRPTPPHYHATCDEYLYALSGRGTFWMKDPSTKAEFGPGQLLFFERGTVHAMPEIFEEPLVFLAIDTPRREPSDIIFVDPRDGSPETFMARNATGR